MYTFKIEILNYLSIEYKFKYIFIYCSLFSIQHSKSKSLRTRIEGLILFFLPKPLILIRGFIDFSLWFIVNKYSQHHNNDPFLSTRDIIITSYNFKILSFICVKKKVLQITIKIILRVKFFYDNFIPVECIISIIRYRACTITTSVVVFCITNSNKLQL